MRFYTVTVLSPNQSLTREGFLVCKNVAVARTGIQDYLPEEILDENGKIAILPGDDGLVHVERLEEHVFHSDTIDSFQSKPVTIGHPSQDVNPRNWSSLAVGTVMNVRRGEGEQSDLLLADLFLTDAQAIRRVRDKDIREISCGYDAGYEQIAPGRAIQKQIVGNHVAILDRGRCGSRCAIKDKKMPTKSKWADKMSAFHDRIRRAFKAGDEDQLETLLESRDESGDPEGALTEMKTALEEIGDNVNEMKENHTRLEERLGAVDARLTAVDAKATDAAKRLAARDEAEKTKEEQEEEEKEKARKAKKAEEESNGSKDSAELLEDWNDTIARAEILTPGVRLPTRDAALGATKLKDTLCQFRRTTLTAVLADPKKREYVSAFTGKNTDIAALTCDQARMAFVGASELMKAANNSCARASSFDAAYDEAHITTSAIKAMQDANRKRWPRPTV